MLARDPGPDGVTADDGAPHAAKTLLAITGLTVAFTVGSARLPVLHGIDLAVGPGETLGMVGESGCGKSVTWLAVLRLLGPRALIGGTVALAGRSIADLPEERMVRLRGRRIAMIFQDPISALNPVHTIGRQIGEALVAHRGATAAAARAEAARLLDQVGIPAAKSALQRYPHELSGGMNQRAMIAMCLAGRPDLLIADEPTTALDVTIQAQILDLLRQIQRDLGMALVLVSHDLGVVAEVCRRVAVMYCGRIVEQGDTDAIFDRPQHPYTRGLLAALPSLDGPRRRLQPIPGTVPAPGALPAGCAFAPRCPRAAAVCRSAVPPLRPIVPGHRAACVRAAGPDAARAPAW